jgi:hypothetical protein
MKRYQFVCASTIVALSAAMATACVDVASGVSNTDGVVSAIGPDHDADVPLATADVWTVPPLDINKFPEMVVWTMEASSEPATVTVRRFCQPMIQEPFLWLHQPTEDGGVVAMLHGCGKPNEFFGTVTLSFDGAMWVGLSASGAATLVPPK